MVPADDGDAGLLGGEISSGDIVGSALFSGVCDSHRGGLGFMDGRGSVGRFAGCFQKGGERCCHRGE
jgi:hypothetical protein